MAKKEPTFNINQPTNKQTKKPNSPHQKYKAELSFSLKCDCNRNVHVKSLEKKVNMKSLLNIIYNLILTLLSSAFCFYTCHENEDMVL